jgi:L-serine dehydratase
VDLQRRHFCGVLPLMPHEPPGGNAVAASSAFVCADLVLGGYRNPVPLDETIDAVFAVGKMMPSELRCTSRGGLAVTPSALRLTRERLK